jgi:hypothetical protein
MSVDPRLANIELLALAALRLRERQQAEPTRCVQLRVVYYDARGIEPLLEGPTYVYDEAAGTWREDPC